MSDPETNLPDPDWLAELVARVLAHPYQRFCGLELIEHGQGQAVTRFPINENTANTVGTLHAGALYGMIDISSVFALVTVLDPTLRPVSHDLRFSVMRMASKGEFVEIRTRVLRAGRRIAFVDAQAWSLQAAIEGPSDCDAEPTLIASATIVKSIVARE